MATYTVKPNDCLWNIAVKELGDGKRWPEIAKLNTATYSSLKNSTVIQPGWVLEIPGSSGGGTTSKTTASNRAVVDFLGPESADNDRTLLAVWSWSRTSDLDKYLIEWIYTVEGGHTLYATQTISTDEGYESFISKQTTWTVPENAITVKVKVKPVAKKKTVNNKETTPWTAAGWSTVDSKSTFNTKYFPPDAPPVPSLEINGTKLTARVDGIELDDRIQKQTLEIRIIKDDNESSPYKTGYLPGLDSTTGLYYTTVAEGARYKAQCRMKNTNPTIYSEWSSFSSNVYSRPKAPTKLKVKAVSENSVRLEWVGVNDVTEYEYQYTEKEEYFDTSSYVTSGSVDYPSNVANIKDLQTGNFTYFFRVRSKGNGGSSEWSNIVNIALGKEPAAPTTWSSTTTAVVGTPVNLYWVHNSTDDSSQTYAELLLKINGTVIKETIQNTYTNDDDRDDTSIYTINTSSSSDGATLSVYKIESDGSHKKLMTNITNKDIVIEWQVRTSGILTKNNAPVYGNWSVQRVIEVNAPPTINLQVTKKLNGTKTDLDTFTNFPIYVEASAEPRSQTPIGYHLAIVAEEGYETVDHMGNPRMISAGETIYSKYFDNNFSINGVSALDLYVELNAGSVDFENNIDYTITCTVTMSTGLTAEESKRFTVSWEDNSYVPNAEIGYDPDTYSTMIKPYCRDESNRLISGVTLSVYRREYDGSYTELMTNIPNNGYTFITDPHPALDYARYRVVATVGSTGAIGFYDIPGYPIDESAAIIQWNENWSTFDAVEAEPLATPTWTGSLLRLPYNIDISSGNAKDVALVEYIGREHPVTYYGTQLGETNTLKTDIPANDIETLYALRRLMRWKGDVYVRLPNGIGYWAVASVQYNENHKEVKIPVTIDITRVEGGV